MKTVWLWISVTVFHPLDPGGSVVVRAPDVMVPYATARDCEWARRRMTGETGLAAKIETACVTK